MIRCREQAFARCLTDPAADLAFATAMLCRDLAVMSQSSNCRRVAQPPLPFSTFHVMAWPVDQTKQYLLVPNGPVQFR
jgi:hypothetical protein